MQKLYLLIGLLGFFHLRAKDAVSFELKNNTLHSIYLEIPGVMNPRFSPMSVSGVILEEGQEIFFFHAGERHLLLKVDASYAGSRIVVNKRIKARKKILGLN